MNFFNDLFGNNGENQEFQDDEQDLLEKYGAIVLEKQLDFADLIGEYPWSVDMKKGEISFTEDLTFNFQIMGTFSHSSETWLWAWANEQSGIPEPLLEQALKLKKYGEEHNIDLLTLSDFDFSQEELHLMGTIAAGLFDNDAYYVADYGQGAMLVTINDDKIKNARKDSPQRVLTVFPQFISQFDVNHKNAFENYLMLKGYEVYETENAVKASKNGNEITTEFDKLSRLTNLKG